VLRGVGVHKGGLPASNGSLGTGHQLWEAWVGAYLRAPAGAGAGARRRHIVRVASVFMRGPCCPPPPCACAQQPEVKQTGLLAHTLLKLLSCSASLTSRILVRSQMGLPSNRAACQWCEFSGCDGGGGGAAHAGRVNAQRLPLAEVHCAGLQAHGGCTRVRDVSRPASASSGLAAAEQCTPLPPAHPTHSRGTHMPPHPHLGDGALAAQLCILCWWLGVGRAREREAWQPLAA
jgi:hypothetical protein